MPSVEIFDNLARHIPLPILPQFKGKTITPKACFAVKTKVVGAELKVFINLCSHEEIDAPSVKKKLNTEGESVEGMGSTSTLLPHVYQSKLTIFTCTLWS